MAESQAVAKQALEKLEDQLTCAICLDAFKDPKLLQCFHVYCKDCLQRLVVTDRQGQLSLRCPTCRQSTLLPPATGVSGLQSAFHIHHLMEIQDALKKVKDPQKVQCEKCTKTTRTATNFCRDCGKFICEKCTEMHSEWEEISNHEVVSMEKIQSNIELLVPPKKVTLYCSHHEGMNLNLYCETCEELICLHCTVNKHCRPEHKYDLVGDTFQRHKAEITLSLEPVEEQLGVVSKTLEQYDLRSQQLDQLEVAMEANIGQEIRKLQEILEARKAELVGQMKQLIRTKRKNLSAQKDEVETVHAQLTSCLSFVRESLRTGSQREVMNMKNAVIKWIKEMTNNFKPHKLPPCEQAYVKFIHLCELTEACQQFGDVYIPKVSLEKCYVSGKGMEVAEIGERTTAVLHVVDQKGDACTVPVKTMITELVLSSTNEKIECLVDKININQYEITYQATCQGRHQLHIKVEGEHMYGSPFPVAVIKKLGTPIKIISGVKEPRDVAVNQRGEIIVGESGTNRVSIFSSAGEILRSFGSKGSKQGQFDRIRGVAVDDTGNIYVADGNNHRIQKFTPDGNFITAVGRKGSGKLQFNIPKGGAIHPLNKKIYVADRNNHRIQILKPDLTFSSSFGSYGCGSGQFNRPSAVAFDSTGNVYVADYHNDCIQVFTAEGEFIRKFGQRGSGSGELHSPSRISVDSDNNVVYVTEAKNRRISVFTCEGKFLTLFGKNGNGPGEFSDPHGIAVDKDGVIYVCDTDNNRLQLF
jgi:tripartite motif-containing protein 2/3/tripartite motif-containing protein 71